MTSRQFYIIVLLFSIVTKIQRFPSLLYDVCGKDGYLIIAIYGVLNIIGIMIAFLIYKLLSNKILKEEKNNKYLEFLKKLTMLALAFYFITEALILFEHVQNIFADTLFDKFSWSIFSLLFLFAIFYLAKSGIKNIAINFELFAAVIVGSLFMIAVLGSGNADYSVVLPFESIDFNNLFSNIFKFNIWFGDFFIILCLLFHTKKARLSKTILAYCTSIISVLFLTITFYGIFGDYSALQPGLISTITEQSMLGINIGRADWFLILIAEIGTILSCSVCIYFANKGLCSAFPKIKPLYIAIFIAALFYVINVYVLLDKFIVREYLFFGIGSKISLILKIALTLLIFIVALKNFTKSKKQKKESFSGKIF